MKVIDATVAVDLVRADVLGDATRLARDDVGRPDPVEQRRLAVVDVAHHRDDRRARLEQRLVVVVLAEHRLQLELGLLAGLDEQHLGAERLGDQLDHLVGERLRPGDHLARVEEQADEVGGVAVQPRRQLLQRAAAGHDDLTLGNRGVERRERGRGRGTEVLEVATTTLLAARALTAGTTRAASAATGATASGRTAAGAAAGTATGARARGRAAATGARPAGESSATATARARATATVGREHARAGAGRDAALTGGRRDRLSGGADERCGRRRDRRTRPAGGRGGRGRRGRSRRRRRGGWCGRGRRRGRCRDGCGRRARGRGLAREGHGLGDPAGRPDDAVRRRRGRLGLGDAAGGPDDAVRRRRGARHVGLGGDGGRLGSGGLGRRTGRGRRTLDDGLGLGFRLGLPTEALRVREAADPVGHRVLDARRVALRADLQLFRELHHDLVLDAQLPSELVDPDLLRCQRRVPLVPSGVRCRRSPARGSRRFARVVGP